MIRRYLDGSIAQLIERGKLMTASIPRDLPRAYDTLAQTCRTMINGLLADLRRLNDDDIFRQDSSQSERVRKFKRVVADLDFVETVGISALKKAQKDDHSLNVLLERIAREIAYPAETPVVTPLSHSYFHIFPELRLLRVPLVEGHFLLHLPDLYHELAHPLLTEENDPVIEPFQQKFADNLRACLSYLRGEQVKEERRRGPAKTQYMLRAWESSWAKYWLTEFYCDMFAVFTTGPAFAWSHLHLAVKRGTDPFAVPEFSASSHPADDARMRAMLRGLMLNGFQEDEVKPIQKAWDDLLRISGAHSEPEYDWCYPTELLDRIASDSFAGLCASNIRPHSPHVSGTVASSLNGAWKHFWEDAIGFTNWEKHEVQRLFAECHGFEQRIFT